MDTFQDVNGYQVRFSYKENSFSKEASHVLVICRFYDQWLFTKHKKRGLEFPGGKKEFGETLEEAAIREVGEETGAILKTLEFIGEYEVTNKEESFVKSIFYGDVESIMEKENYLETDGPVLFSGDLLTARWEEQYSFIMKDKVIEKALIKIIGQKASRK